MTKAEIENQIRDIKKLMEDSQEKLSELEKMLSEKSNEIPDYPVFDNERSWIMTVQLESLNFGITKCNADNIFPDFNLFHEKYFADEFAKKCKFIAMLLHCKQYLCPTYFPNFKNEKENKWVVCYDYASNTFEITCWTTYWESQVYFDTKENAQKAADWMKEHFKFS